MKKYKIAVCISGEARTYRDCIANIARYFANITLDNYEVEVDYFIHTWDKTTPKPQYANNQTDCVIDIPFIKNHINLIDYKQDKGRTELEDTRYWKPMFYSMYYCNFLKQKYELNNHFTYDLVVRTRFDIIFDLRNRFLIHKMYEQTVYTASGVSRFPNELNCFNFDDVFFYGTSFTMNFMSNIYRYIDKNLTSELQDKQSVENQLNPIFSYGPGCLLYHYMSQYGFNYDRILFVSYTVYRFFNLPEDWDTHRDYDKIREFMMSKYYGINLREKNENRSLL